VHQAAVRVAGHPIRNHPDERRQGAGLLPNLIQRLIKKKSNKKS